MVRYGWPAGLFLERFSVPLCLTKKYKATGFLTDLCATGLCITAATFYELRIKANNTMRIRLLFTRKLPNFGFPPLTLKPLPFYRS
jgi:hypothetical protein